MLVTDYSAKKEKESAKKVSEANIALGVSRKPKISDFDLQEVVGIGNFGKVNKAYNKVQKRVVALKVLVKESVAAMKQVEHIISEKEVLEYLSGFKNECPFVMGIFSSFQDEAHLYFELEYIEGCTLLSQIRTFNTDVTLNFAFYFQETLLTIEYLH